MAKDFNLMSQKWLDLIFKDKNKAYGAYELRESSSDRHLKAVLLVTVVGLALVYLPGMIKSIIPEKAPEVSETVIAQVTEVNLEEVVPEENQIRELESVPPAPELKASVKLTIPDIVDDELVREEDLMLSQQDLTDTQASISIATVEGVEDGTVDIADLEDHKVVIQATEPEIHEYAEEPPQFPGGDAELSKWLKNNIKFPQIAQDNGVNGVVVLQFVVGTDGSIEDITVVKTLDPSCDKEARTKIAKMPKWNPGRQNGIPVKVRFTLRVRFEKG